MMMRLRFLSITLVLAVVTLYCQSAFAEANNEYVQKGIKAFHANDYKTAASQLSMALSSEFNNPKVHYYLANSYVELGRNQAAIREFRIAHALSPDSEIGRFSLKALNDLTGASPAKSAAKEEKTNQVTKSVSELEKHLSKTMNSVDKQVDKALNDHHSQTQQRATAYAKTGDAIVKHTEMEMMKSLINSGRYPKLNRTHRRQLRDLQRMYAAKTMNQMRSGNQRASHIQESSENLKRLLRDSKDQKGHHLKPYGTNLYIRNYGE